MTDQQAEMDHRDVQLGEAIHRFDPPEHAAGYWAAAERRLGAAAAAPLPWYRRRPVWFAATAATATAVLLIVTLVGLPGRHSLTPVPEQAAASQLLERVTLAMSSAHSLSATLTQRSRDAGRETWTVVSEGKLLRTAAGDYRIEQHFLDPGEPPGGQHPPVRKITTYDAGTHTARDLVWTVDNMVYGHAFANTRVEMDSLTGLWRNAAAVRALLAEASPTTPVQEITFDGSPAWQARLGQSIAKPWFVEIVVDQKTGFLLRERIRHLGSIEEWTYGDLVVDDPISPDAFTIDFPTGARIITIRDDGYHALSLDDLETSLGYLPPTPTQLPTGFALTEVVRWTDPSGATDGADGPQEITLWYRRGFDWLSVSVGPLPDGVTMPPEEMEKSIRMNSPETAASMARARLNDGLFAGATAFSAIDPIGASVLGPVGLMIVGDRYVVTMTGDLTRAELLRAAESFELWRE